MMTSEFEEMFRRYFKRCYWLVVTAYLLYMMLTSTRSLILSYLHNSLTFSIDTAYLHWNTTFPAVSVCQLLNDETIAEMIERQAGPSRDHRLDSVISELAFYGGSCHSCEYCHPGRRYSDGYDNCPGNFSAIVDQYRVGCAALLANCTWQDRPFDCCRMFVPLETEFGVCFSINSRNGNAGVPEMPLLVSNRHTGPGLLRFRLLEDAQLFLHDQHAVPYAHVDRAHQETVLWGMHKELVVRVVGMDTEDAVQDVPIERRACRFPWEIADVDTQLYDSYSFSSCAVECFMKTQMKYCQCVHHLMPNLKNSDSNKNYPRCNYEGLTCLTENSGHIARHRKQCQCLSSCIEPEFFVIYSSEIEQEYPEDLVTIRMVSLSHSKFVRRATRTDLDLFSTVERF